MAAPTTGAMIAAIASEWGAIDTAKLYWDNTNGRLGIGVTPSYTFHVSGRSYFYSSVHLDNSLVTAKLETPNVAADAANYDIGLGSDVTQTYAIATSKTDSGYRMGLDLNVYATGTGFLGTLTSQFGIRIAYGHYNPCGAGTISGVYGIYLNYIATGSATITSCYSIYSYGEGARMSHAGMVSIGIDNNAYKLQVKGTGATASTWSFVTTNTSSITTFFVNDAGGGYFATRLGVGSVPTTASPLRISYLPTSTSGLSTGEIWNNLGFLCIV